MSYCTYLTVGVESLEYTESQGRHLRGLGAVAPSLPKEKEKIKKERKKGKKEKKREKKEKKKKKRERKKELWIKSNIYI